MAVNRNGCFLERQDREILTHGSLISVCKSQTFHKYDENFKDKLLHQGIFLPAETETGKTSVKALKSTLMRICRDEAVT